MKQMRFLPYLLLFLPALCLTTCNSDAAKESPEFREAGEVLHSWNHLLLSLEKSTQGYRPPISARMFAYVEMAAYEASLPALPDHISMGKYCSGYQPAVPPGQDYHLVPALNAAYAAIARDFFPTAPDNLLAAISKLETENLARIHANNPDISVQASIDFGRQTARAVWEYSTTDSIGHDGFMYNFDRDYRCEQAPGKWKPDKERPMPPLLPHWGKVRTFVTNFAELKVNPPPAYSEATNSACYTQAFEVYSISQSLTSEDRWIADFWSDDIPGFTITPASRWISITSQAIAQSKPGFVKSLELYLKVGMALCDAGIACWAIKYQYQTERPQTYINRLIQGSWAPLHKNPSFPSYPSGHASFGSGAATVLAAYFGEHYHITDRTHEGRDEFASKSRSYGSFSEMARENAYSRLLNGVHYRADAEEGMRLGTDIGEKVLALPLEKDKVVYLKIH